MFRLELYFAQTSSSQHRSDQAESVAHQTCPSQDTHVGASDQTSSESESSQIRSPIRPVRSVHSSDQSKQGGLSLFDQSKYGRIRASLRSVRVRSGQCTTTPARARPGPCISQTSPSQTRSVHRSAVGLSDHSESRVTPSQAGSVLLSDHSESGRIRAPFRPVKVKQDR